MPLTQPDLSVLSGNSAAGPKADSIAPPPVRWKSRILLPGIVLTAFIGLLLYSARDAILPATTVHVVPVVATIAGGGSGTVSFQSAGWIEPDPHVVHVSALADGIVKEVPVLEGQQVKAGDVVVRMVDDDAKLAVARADADLKQREAEVQTAQAALTAAQRDWDNPIDRTRALAQAENALLENKAELTRLQSEIEVEQARAEELQEELKRNISAGTAIPEFQTTQVRLKLKTQTAILELARSRAPVLAAQIRQKEADLVAARENLRLRIIEAKALEDAKAMVARSNAMVLTATAMRDEARLRLDRMTLRAPVDGTVMHRRTQPGSKLMLAMDDEHSAQAVGLYDPNKLQVRVDVPLAEAANVSVGQRAQVTVEVLRDKVFEGIVTRIMNEADIQKNTLQVKVHIDNPASQIKPEMLARVQFLAVNSDKENRGSLRAFAPENALKAEAGGGASAWVVDKGRGVAMHRMVSLGTNKRDGWIDVTAGLQPGDSVIVGDTSGLSEGQRVKTIEDATPSPNPTPGAEHHGTH
jgi:HlyD family secretion protein